MKLLEIILLAVLTVTVAARHRKEWQKVNVSRLGRERLQTFYKSDIPTCIKGAGFYRDPHNCHQYIRCVDEFGTGRHLHVYVGKCEPGLVFDENVSACNWPDLAAPCSNSPEKLQDSRKPYKPEQNPEDNVVFEESTQNKPYPIQQQQVVQEQQNSDVYGTQQKEIPAVEDIQIAAQESIYQDKIEQTFIEAQNPEEPFEEQVQDEKVEEQVFQKPEIQQQNIENVQAMEQPTQKEQNIQSEQQQIIYQQQNENDRIDEGSRTEQASLGGFQEVADQEFQQFEIPQQAQLDKFPQHESQSQWWVADEKPHHNPPETSEQMSSSDIHQEPFLCSNEGFYRHPENSSQFIRCVKIGNGAYAVHFFECPKQLVFDEKDSSCIVANIQSSRSNLRKKRQASDTKLQCKGEGFFRHPDDCRAFYRCVKSATGSYETHLFSCPANLVFDEEYTTCNWPEKAPPCDSQQQFYQPTRKPAKVVQTEKPGPQYKPPSRSTSRGSWSTAKPQNDYIDKSITQETYSRKRNTERPKSTETGAKCRSPGFFANDDDCTKFFKCVKKGNSFIRYDLACPQNFAFDDRSKRCVAQRYVSSCSRNKPPYPPRQDDEETTVSPDATTTAGSSSSQTGNDDIKCEKEGYFRHPQDCNKFYRCVDFDGNGEEFVRYDFNCPEELVFDEANSVCNWPDQSAPCDTRGGGGQGPGEDGGSDGSDTGESGTGENEGNDDRESTTSSTAGQPSTESVESTSSAPANENEQKGSENESDGSESGGPESENECTKEGYFRNPDDCNKFYRCVDFNGDGKEFVRYDFNCPEGLVFDEKNSVCNWPAESEPCDTRSGGGNQDVNEGDGTDTTTSSSPDRGGEPSEDSSESEQTTPSDTRSSSSTPESESSSESSSSASGTDDSRSSTQSSNEDSRKSNGECTEEGFFRDPDDCNKFYRCVDQNENGQFVKYDFTCPEGLVFDEVNSVCNWPDQSAPCDGGSPGKGESSTSGPEGDRSESTSKSSSGGTEATTTTTTSSTTERSQSTSGDDSSSTTERSQSTSGEDSSSSTTQRSTSESEGTSSSPERESGGNQGECTKEGFYRNPEDCTKFYRCVDQNGDGKQFVKYDFDCPEGLVFDEVNSVCNWPDQSAPCDGERGAGENKTTDSDSSQTESSSSTEESMQSSTQEPSQQSTQSSDKSPCGDTSECKEPGFYRCKDDCTKFYRCVEEDDKLVRYDFKCPDGLIFDDRNKKCDYPSSELTCEEDSSTTAATTNSETSSASSTKECTEEGFFRDQDDCRKYYRCIDEGDGTFTREDHSCGEDEVFDEEMRYCNRKDLAPPPCGDSETTSSQSQTTSSTQTTSSESQSSTTEKSTTAAQSSTDSSTQGSSSSECSQPGFYRCKDDCNKFYRCVEEDDKLVRYDFKCPDGLIFDDRNKKCDWPSSELTCDEDSSTTSATTKSETSSSTSSTKECTEEGFFRDPDDCRKYYRCIDEGDGTYSREDYSCGEDEVFDEEMRYCNRKDLAPPPCGDSETTSSQSQTTSSTRTTSSESQSSTTEKSTTAAQSSTESSTQESSSSDCSQPGFYRCKDDCNKFYRCVEEDDKLVRYDFKCPDGLIFDERNDKCDWPSSELTCDTESTTSSTSESSTSGSQTSGTTSSSSTSSSDDKSAEGCTEEGFFRNPDDCSKYYRCQDEGDGTLRREDFACEEDEVFDEEMRYCNRKDLAPPCDGSSSTTERSGSSTSQTSSEQESESTTSSSGTTSRAGESGSGECTEEGFHRDPNDCSKFYRCVDFEGNGESFTRYDFDCPEGLVFDESNDVCNWPSSVPSCESGGQSEKSTESSSSSETSSAATSDSSDSSTSAATQAEQTSSTSRGSEESTTESSNTSATSSDTTSGGTTSSGTTSGGTTSDGTTSGGTTSDDSTSSGGSGSSDNIECTEEGFFRHPEDCTKFYRCVDFAGTGESFVRYDFECGEGTVFDDVNNVCNWPEQSPSCESKSSSNKKSGDDNSGDNSTTSDSTSGSSTSDNSGGDSSSTPQDQTTRSSTSTSSSSSEEFRCEEEGYFKHPSDCKKYYECKRDEETGELVKIDCECPEGQVWDNEGWYCNAEELSPPCENGDSSSGGSFKCKEEGFFRDPEDCSKYYQCNRTGSGENDFTSEKYQCDDGLVFDEEGRYCNAPELSQPCDGSSSTSKETTNSESSRGTTSSDQSATSSDQSTSSGQSEASSDQGQCTREGFSRNPEDCTKYYLCSKNEETGEFDRTDYSCPDGRIFDEGSNYCNEPELSNEPCDSNSNGQSTTTRRTSTESSPSGARRSGGNPECTEEGFFRHPDDCAKFYRCVDFSGSGESFVRYDFDCPEGTHFDEVNSVCNWPTMTPSCESSNRRIFRWNSDVDIKPQ